MESSNKLDRIIREWVRAKIKLDRIIRKGTEKTGKGQSNQEGDSVIRKGTE